MMLLDMVDVSPLLDFPMANIWKSFQLYNLNKETTVLGTSEEIYE